MDITSIVFLIFLLSIISLYFILPANYQWMVLLGGSIGFYLSYSLVHSIFIGITIVTTWLCGICLENKNKQINLQLKASTDSAEKKAIKKQGKFIKKLIISIFITFNLGILIYLKYYNFIGESINAIFHLFDSPYEISNKKLLLPIGISFYTFQSIGYIFDIYRNKSNAQENLAKYALFVLFFPQIIQGPFNRYKDLSKTLYSPHSISYTRMKFGMQRVLWGYIKKRVIADRLGLLVSPVFNAYTQYSGYQIWIAVVAYTLQIYADFSGYMDIMCGICEVLDIKMYENFNHPYFSKSVAEFWRRWHITLGAWFREYMFYPISMSKPATRLGKKLRKYCSPRFSNLFPSYLALIAVWFCTGLWHGANWTYVVWALINVFFILTSMQFEEFYAKCRTFFRVNVSSFYWRLFQVMRTFLLVCFMRIFSRANTISEALGMYQKLFTDFHVTEAFKLKTYQIGLSSFDCFLLIVFIALMLIISLYQRQHQVRELISKQNAILRWMIYLSATFSLILFEVTSGGGFLYAVF